MKPGSKCGRVRLGVMAMLLASGSVLAPQSMAQDAQVRVRELEATHAESLGDLCRALDAELLRVLPGWDDQAVRWALFGVPTDAERSSLRRRVAELRDLVDAAGPLVERRLREADAGNAEGIEAAVQMIEVLLPLARARGLLLYGAAIDPVVGRSEESRRAFEEAAALADRTESVSAWTDAERGLIGAASLLRIGRSEPAVESIRAVRDAMRERAQLRAEVPGLEPTLRAIETMLVASAKSPQEARGSLPADETDRERLRVRLAAMAAERATSAGDRDRLLRAEADRLANMAMDLALDGGLDVDSARALWLWPLERSGALIGVQGAERLGGSALSAVRLLEASVWTPADGGGARVRRTLEGHELGALRVLGMVLELRVHAMPTAAARDTMAIVRAGHELHLLAPDAAVTRDGLRTVGDLLRGPIRHGVEGVAREDGDAEVVMDLIDVLLDRDDLGRSNLDLIAMATLPPTPSFDRTTLLRTIEASERVVEAMDRVRARDADAVWAAVLTGSALLDGIAREQVADLFGERVLNAPEEERGLRTMRALGDLLARIGVGGQAGLARSMQAMFESELGDGERAAALIERTEDGAEFVALWVREMVRNRAGLKRGEAVRAGSDGERYGVALFAKRDVPERFDLRWSLPEPDERFGMAGSAAAAASALMEGDADFVRLAIRCYSAALRAEDPDVLRVVVRDSARAADVWEHAPDRAWASLLGAEAMLRLGDDAGAFAALRGVVARTPAEDRSARSYWHASMRMLEILVRQNADGSRREAIAREVRRLRLQPSWGTHTDLSERIERIGLRVGVVEGER